MSLVLKNTTNSDIFVKEAAQNLASNSSRTITPTTYRRYTESVIDNSTFRSQVLNEDVIVEVDGNDLTPADGVRYLETLNLRESTNAVTGSLFSIQFSDDNPSNDSWLEAGHNGLSTDDTPYLLPFDCKLVAITLSNEDVGTNYNIDFYRIPFQGGSSTIFFNQSTNNTRFITNRSVSNSNFFFNAGDKIAAFANNGSNQDNLIIQMWFQVTAGGTNDLFDNSSTQADD